LVLNIVAEKKENSDWHAELSRAIKVFLENSELSRAKVALQYKYSDEDFNEEYLSKGLAALYNYFTIKDGRCRVNNEKELKSFVVNADKFSLEHLIINKSKKYKLSEEGFYSVQGESGKCVNSIFNFVFVPEDINNEALTNRTLREKMIVLMASTPEKPALFNKIECPYSRKVLEYIDRYFINESEEIHTLHSGLKAFPEFKDQMSDTEKENILNNYFNEDSGAFFNTFM